MMRAVVLVIILAALSLVGARPSPQFYYDGQKLLDIQGRRYHRYPLLWVRRYYYDGDDYDFAGNDGYGSQLRSRPSTVSYASVGAGWGR